MNFKILTILLLCPIFALAQSESAFDDTNELSLAEEEASETYVHQGIAADKYQEMCNSKNRDKYKDICSEDQLAFEGGIFKSLEIFLPALTKAYALFNTVGGGGKMEARVLNEQGQQEYVSKIDGKEEKYFADEPKSDRDTASKEEHTDYCGYIAVVSEAASTAYMLVRNQKTEQNYTSNKPEAKQAASFYALADNHKDMGKAAKVQAGVWAATAGCYAIYVAQAQYRGDWKVYAKLGASVFIAGFYKKKADAHKERANLLTQMAKDLPQAGDCNPFTERTCFCSEESSYSTDPGNFNKYCVPAIMAARNQSNDAYVCTNQKGETDTACECTKTNTCIDRTLKLASANLGLSPTVMRDPIAAIKPLSKGFGTANIQDASDKSLALAKKALKSFNPNTSIPLNSTEKGLAKDFSLEGISPAAAALMAKTKTRNAALPKSATSFGSGFSLKPRKAATNSVAKINSSDFQKGNTIRTQNRSGSSFPKFGKKRSNKGGVVIDDRFDQKALREAEILPENNGKGIFEVISTRYQKRAWNNEFREVILEEMKK